MLVVSGSTNGADERIPVDVCRAVVGARGFEPLTSSVNEGPRDALTTDFAGQAIRGMSQEYRRSQRSAQVATPGTRLHGMKHLDHRDGRLLCFGSSAAVTLACRGERPLFRGVEVALHALPHGVVFTS